MLVGCPGEGIGKTGSLVSDDVPEVTSTPASFEFVADSNSLSETNLKTTLTVSVLDAFGVNVSNVQVKFTIPDGDDQKVAKLGSLTSGSEVVVLSSDGVATVELSAKATGNPSDEIVVKAELVGYSIEAKTLDVFVKEIPLSFNVQDLPKVIFNKGSFEFVSIQVVDPDGNPVNGVDVTIVKEVDSPLKFYDIKTTLSSSGVASAAEVLTYTTEGDGIISFNLWSNESSGTQPVITKFNIKVGSSSEAVPSNELTVFFVELVNTGSIDSLKANGHDSRTLNVRLDGELDEKTHFIRWKTTLGNIAGDGITLSKELSFSNFGSSSVASATLSVGNESGKAIVTASLISSIADDNDTDVVLAELTYNIEFLEAKPAVLTVVVDNSSLVSGSGNIFTFTGQVQDSDNVGIDNIPITITTAGEVTLEVADQVISDTLDENRGAFRFNASAFNVAGRWTITLTADSITTSITFEQLSDEPSAILINDGNAPESIFVKGTGNKENTSIEFKVLDRFGNPISDNLGVKVSVSIQSGPGGGEQVDPTIPTETVNGIVSANIRSGNQTGTVRVHAEIENNPTISADTNIAIVKGPLDASSINITPNFYNVSGRHIANMELGIFASLADAAGDAVPDGQQVTFVTKGTGNFFQSGSDTTVNGIANDKLITAANPDPFFGFSVLTAEANGAENLFVGAMAFLSGADIVFAGTIGGGIKRTNGIAAGNISWLEVNGEFVWVGQNVKDLKIVDNTTSIFAATTEGLYKSTNLGSTWIAIRNEANPNRPGFTLKSLNTSTVNSIAYTNDYIGTTGTSDPEELARDPNDVDIIVGSNGEGVWLNRSRGESFSIVDADGYTTDGVGQNGATLLDGAITRQFNIGEAGSLYYISNTTRTGFFTATSVTNAATYRWVSVKPTGVVVPTTAEFIRTDGAGAVSVNIHDFPNLSYNDKNSNGVYDVSEEIVAKGIIKNGTFSGGWIQSGTLGTGNYINRLASRKSVSTNYVIAATNEGVMASVGGNSVGEEWSNIGINGGNIFIKKALITDIHLKSDLTLYASTGEFGIYKFTGLSIIPATPLATAITSGWTKLSTPKAADTILSNLSSATGKDNTALSVLDSQDRLYYTDSDGNGIFNGEDQIVIIPEGETAPSTVVFPSGSATSASATYLPAETASEFLRYVDLDQDGKYTNASDILLLDWNDNLVFDETEDDYQSFNAVREVTIDTVPYIFAAATNGGVFYVKATGITSTSVWNKIDIRDTGVGAKRLYDNTDNSDSSKTSLYICTSKNAAIIEISAISSTVIGSKTSVVTFRNVSVGQTGAGSIDTKIRGTTAILSTGVINPSITLVPAHNQYVQNLSNDTLFKELTQTQMLDMLTSNSLVRTGVLLNVAASAGMELSSVATKPLMGATPSVAVGNITFVGNNYLMVTETSGTFAAGDTVWQQGTQTATTSVSVGGRTAMSTISNATTFGALLTSLSITLSGDNENKANQLITAGLLTSTSYANILSSITTSSLLLVARGLTNVNAVELTNFSTEEGQMYLYLRANIADDNANPPVFGTTVKIEVDEIEVDVDTSGVIGDITRTNRIYDYSFTYADIVSRGVDSTIFTPVLRLGFIVRDPTTAPSGTSWNDKVMVTFTVTAPTGTTSPGNNGAVSEIFEFTRARGNFTPGGGATLIRQ